VVGRFRSASGQNILIIQEMQPSVGYRSLNGHRRSRQGLDEWRRLSVQAFAERAAADGYIVYFASWQAIAHAYSAAIFHGYEVIKNYVDPVDDAAVWPLETLIVNDVVEYRDGHGIGGKPLKFHAFHKNANRPAVGLEEQELPPPNRAQIAARIETLASAIYELNTITQQIREAGDTPPPDEEILRSHFDGKHARKRLRAAGWAITDVIGPIPYLIYTNDALRLASPLLLDLIGERVAAGEPLDADEIFGALVDPLEAAIQAQPWFEPARNLRLAEAAEFIKRVKRVVGLEELGALVTAWIELVEKEYPGAYITGDERRAQARLNTVLSARRDETLAYLLVLVQAPERVEELRVANPHAETSITDLVRMLLLDNSGHVPTHQQSVAVLEAFHPSGVEAERHNASMLEAARETLARAISEADWRRRRQDADSGGLEEKRVSTTKARNDAESALTSGKTVEVRWPGKTERFRPGRWDSTKLSTAIGEASKFSHIKGNVSIDDSEGILVISPFVGLEELQEEVLFSFDGLNIADLMAQLATHKPYGFDYFDGARVREKYLGGSSSLPETQVWEEEPVLGSWILLTERTRFDLRIVRDEFTPAGRTYAIIIGRSGLEEIPLPGEGRPATDKLAISMAIGGMASGVLVWFDDVTPLMAEFLTTGNLTVEDAVHRLRQAYPAVEPDRLETARRSFASAWAGAANNIPAAGWWELFNRVNDLSPRGEAVAALEGTGFFEPGQAGKAFDDTVDLLKQPPAPFADEEFSRYFVRLLYWTFASGRLQGSPNILFNIYDGDRPIATFSMPTDSFRLNGITVFQTASMHMMAAKGPLMNESALVWFRSALAEEQPAALSVSLVLNPGMTLGVGAGLEDNYAAASERVDQFRSTSAPDSRWVVIIGREIAQRFPGLQVVASLWNQRIVVDNGNAADTMARAAQRGDAIHFYGGLEEGAVFRTLAERANMPIVTHNPAGWSFLLLIQDILRALGVPEEVLATGLEEFSDDIQALGAAA
jgi:hypothetical protein